MLQTTEKSWSHTRFLADELSRRKARNPRYSLRAFARHLDFDPSAFSRIMKGKQVPTLNKCVEIARKLQLPKPDAQQFLFSALEQQINQMTQAVSEAAHLDVRIEPAWSMTRDALRLASDSVCVVGPDFRILFINPPAAAKVSQIIGKELSTATLIGKTWEELGMPEHHANLFHEQETAVFRTGRSDTRELTLGVGSSTLCLERCISPVIGRNGAIPSILVISRDITDHKRLEGERNRLAHRVRTLQIISSRLTGPLSPTDAARMVVNETALAIEATAGAVYLLSPASDSLELLATTDHALPCADRSHHFLSPREGSAFREAIRCREPLWWTSGPPTASQGGLCLVRSPGDEGEIVTPTCALPLLVNGECIGAIGFVFNSIRSTDLPEREFLRTIAHLCARAVAFGPGWERPASAPPAAGAREACRQHG